MDNFCNCYRVTDRQTGILTSKNFQVHVPRSHFGNHLSDCYTMSKLVFDRNVLLFFCVPLYLRSFGNVYPFPKETILLSIRITDTNFIKFYAHNNHDFKEIPSISYDALRYFCISLYKRYLGQCAPKIIQLISHNT